MVRFRFCVRRAQRGAPLLTVSFKGIGSISLAYEYRWCRYIASIYIRTPLGARMKLNGALRARCSPRMGSQVLQIKLPARAVGNPVERGGKKGNAPMCGIPTKVARWRAPLPQPPSQLSVSFQQPLLGDLPSCAPLSQRCVRIDHQRVRACEWHRGGQRGTHHRAWVGIPRLPACLSRALCLPGLALCRSLPPASAFLALLLGTQALP